MYNIVIETAHRSGGWHYELYNRIALCINKLASFQNKNHFTKSWVRELEKSTKSTSSEAAFTGS